MLSLSKSFNKSDSVIPVEELAKSLKKNDYFGFSGNDF